jgi:hypothetical protein
MDNAEALQKALKVDRAIGLGAVAFHYGLGLGELKGLPVQIRHLKIGLHQQSRRDVYPVVTDLESQNLSPTQLRHLAGTAASRLILGAALEDWENLGARVGDGTKPDALWRSPQGTLAVEFDCGSYNPEQVALKLERFKRFHGGQVWTTSAPHRQSCLNQRMAAVSNAKAILVDWFLGQ